MSCERELCNNCKPFGRTKCIECKENLIRKPIVSNHEDGLNMKFALKKFKIENRSLVSIESGSESSSDNESDNESESENKRDERNELIESNTIGKDLYEDFKKSKKINSEKAHKKIMNILKSGNIEKHEKEIIDFLETGCDGKDIYNYILKSAKEINKTENIHEGNFIKRFEFLDSFFPLKDLDPYTYLRMISYGFEFKLLKFVDFVGSKNHNVWKKKFIKTYCGVLITDTKEAYCRLDFTTKNMKTLSRIKLFLSSMNESFLNISCFSNTKKYKIKMMNKAIKEKNVSVQLEWKEMLKINWEEYKDKSFVKCNISSMMKDGDFIEKWNKHREALYRI